MLTTATLYRLAVTAALALNVLITAVGAGVPFCPVHRPALPPFSTWSSDPVTVNGTPSYSAGKVYVITGKSEKGPALLLKNSSGKKVAVLAADDVYGNSGTYRVLSGQGHQCQMPLPPNFSRYILYVWVLP